MLVPVLGGPTSAGKLEPPRQVSGGLGTAMLRQLSSVVRRSQQLSAVGQLAAVPLAVRSFSKGAALP